MSSLSLLSQPNFLSLTTQPPNFNNSKPKTTLFFQSAPSSLTRRFRRYVTVSEQATETSPAERKLFVGNIPWTVDNDELTQIVQEHGAVEKAEVIYGNNKRSRGFAFVTMKTVEDANAAVEKLNGTQIGGREIKVNITEKPLTTTGGLSLQAGESQFVDSPYKSRSRSLSAKVSWVPGASKSGGFGFVTFSSDEDVEVAISSFNNALLEGQKIRVNKA